MAVTQHSLALEIFDTACPDVLRIADMSIYGTNLTVECEQLEILLPGYSTAAIFKDTDPTPLDQDFDKKFSASDLSIQAGFATNLVNLPDGIYTIQYSVSPNDAVYVKYYHLRTTLLVNKYLKELCKLQLAECEPDAEVIQKLQDLRYIKSLIDSSKAKVETCHATKQGMDMYNYACKLLDKYQNGTCITCK